MNNTFPEEISSNNHQLELVDIWRVKCPSTKKLSMELKLAEDSLSLRLLA